MIVQPGLPLGTALVPTSLAAAGRQLRAELPWATSLADETLLPLADVLTSAAAVGEHATVDETVAAVTTLWQRAASTGEMSPQTATRFAQMAARFAAYVTAHEVERLADAAGLAGAWVHVRGRDRRGDAVDPQPATLHLRRAVLRALWRAARGLGLSAEDPTLDLVLPARGTAATRPLTDDEVALCRLVAAGSTHDTRGPAVVALSLVSAGTAELGLVRVRDVDGRGVRLPGTRRSAARLGHLDGWSAAALRARAADIGALAPSPAAAADLPLVYAGEGGPAARQAAACVAVSEVLHRAGLAAEADVRPASLSASAGAAAFAATGRIEDAARVLGLRSLDAAARAVGHDWRHPSRAAHYGTAEPLT